MVAFSPTFSVIDSFSFLHDPQFVFLLQTLIDTSPDFFSFLSFLSLLSSSSPSSLSSFVRDIFLLLSFNDPFSLSSSSFHFFDSHFNWKSFLSFFLDSFSSRKFSLCNFSLFYAHFSFLHFSLPTFLSDFAFFFLSDLDFNFLSSSFFSSFFSFKEFYDFFFSYFDSFLPSYRLLMRHRFNSSPNHFLPPFLPFLRSEEVSSYFKSFLYICGFDKSVFGFGSSRAKVDPRQFAESF